MKCVLDPNISKPHALRTAKQAAGILHSLSAEVTAAESLAEHFSDQPFVRLLPQEQLFADADFAVAVGGDGTILRCAEKLLRYASENNTPPARLVGINTGTLGFLAAIEADELDMLGRLQTGDYEISSRMMLRTQMQTAGGETVPLHALNDIYASRLNGKICDFSVSVDERLIGSYRADGIIFSTPTGSTAYALSAGGPVMEPDLSLIEMNLICPHSLFARPMLFAPQRRITVTYRGVGNGGLCVHVDGKKTAELRNAESFTLTVSEHSIPFVNCKGHAFYDALHGKLMQPLKGM